MILLMMDGGGLSSAVGMDISQKQLIGFLKIMATWEKSCRNRLTFTAVFPTSLKKLNCKNSAACLFSQK